MWYNDDCCFIINILVKISSKYKYPHAEVKLYYTKKPPTLHRDNNNNSNSNNNMDMPYIKKSGSMTSENLYSTTPSKLSDLSRSSCDYNIG